MICMDWFTNLKNDTIKGQHEELTTLVNFVTLVDVLSDLWIALNTLQNTDNVDRIFF